MTDPAVLYMRRLLIPLILTLLLLGCARVALTPTPAATPTPTPPPGLAVDCWVDEPNPPLGADVTVHMNLLNRNVPINGLLMTAVWRQGGDLKICNSQVQFDLGACPIHVADFEPGAFVAVTVSVEYIGWTFLGYTGFTPR